MPVPVPVPTYFAPHHHPHPHHSHHEEEYEAYDYAHPHIQLRKDMEELREWGIEPHPEESFDDPGLRPVPDHAPLSPVYPGPNSYAIPHPVPPIRQAPVPGLQYQDKYPVTVAAHAQNLAYNGYIDEHKFNRRVSAQSPVAAPTIHQVPQIVASPINIHVPAANSINLASSSTKTNAKTAYSFPQQQKVNIPQQVNIQQVSKPIQQAQNQRVNQQFQQPVKASGNPASLPLQSNNRVVYDDAFYGPILERLDDIFAQLRFIEESCRERLICSMYKNPGLYSPHSNLVSNELSRYVCARKHHSKILLFMFACLWVLPAYP